MNISDEIIRVIRYFGIYKRLSITFMLIIVIPNLIIATTNYNGYTKEISEITRENLTFITEATSRMLNDYLMKYEEITFEINTDDQVIDLLQNSQELYSEKPNNYMVDGQYLNYKREISDFLYNMSSNNTYLTNIQIVTPYDQINQTSSQGFDKGGFIKNLELFRESDYYNYAIKAKGYPVWYDTTSEINVYFYQRNKGGTLSDYITIMRAIINPMTKENLGIVVMTIDIRFIRNEINFSNLSNMGNILLVSSERSLLSLNENLDAPTINNNEALLSEIVRIDTGQFESEIDGKECVVFSHKVTGIDYYIVQIVEKKILFQDSNDIMKKNILIVVICILFALFIAYIVTKSIAKPLNRLESEMKNVSSQNLDVYYLDEGKDEISRLGHKFNEMIVDINRLIDDLYLSKIRKNESDFKKKEAELNALQMQIKPHFLYNTLDIIRWESLYHNGGESKLSRMIEDFSKLLRFGIKTNVKLVTIDEEVQHIMAYIKVVNYKFEHPVIVECTLENDIGKYKVAKLSLQPLVENAIIHAFDSKDSENTIHIEGSVVESVVTISISDNGCGIQKQQQERINKVLQGQNEASSKAIGLVNVNDRIKLYFGDDYGMMVTSDDSGTKVTIRIPTIMDEGEIDV